MRLDKYLANMGVGTRSEVKKIIMSGKVTVNDVVVKQINAQVDENKDRVAAFNQAVGYSEHLYLMMHKPAGVISATEDTRQKTVIDLIDHPRKKQLFPVGRLDKDTEGLLILTDDGQLAHDLLSPKKHVSKTYYAKIDGLVTLEHVRSFKAGLQVDETFKAMPAELTILSAGEIPKVEVVILEGKFHQVKRMFEAIGAKVLYLKRIKMGSLVLDEKLEKGKARELTEEELRRLKDDGV